MLPPFPLLQPVALPYNSAIQDFADIPFEGLKAAGTPARLRFRDAEQGRRLLEAQDKRVSRERDGQYYLRVPGLAINDHFQLVDEFDALNDRVYIMAVAFIGGFNPDYSGLDFGEAASKLIIAGLFP